MKCSSALGLLVLVGACGTNQTGQPALDASLPACLPNRDGIITEDELPIALGATVNFYASPAGVERDVSLGGVQWDFSQERADDVVVAIGPVQLKDQWYASVFSSGQFVVAAGSGLDGIYHQDSQALWLDGTASQVEGTQKTLIRYSQPLPVLRFPIQPYDKYTSTSALVDSTVSGLPFVGTDKLDVDISLGDVLVPYVEFNPVLKVQTLATRTPSTGTPVVTKRTTIFMFECFGEIARAESRTDEPSAEFTKAAYLRRFALGVKP